MLNWIKEPWPWYVAGPLIGLMVPFLLFLGNKTFGVSASLRHICAATIPAGIPFFNYKWEKEIWNLVFVAGIAIGAFLAATYLSGPGPVIVKPALLQELSLNGIRNHDQLAPPELFNWKSLLTARGFILMVIGGFLVGFGTRYAGGCTSGHSIMGLSNLQFPSLIATVCFMVGGILMANFGLPLILKL